MIEIQTPVWWRLCIARELKENMDPDPEQDRDSEEVVEIIEIDDTEPLSDDDEVVGDDGKMIWKFSV